MVDTEKLEKEYEKNHQKDEYKGKKDYAKKMNAAELDEYVKEYKEKGNFGGLYRMGQESLAFHREYQRMLDKHEAEKAGKERV